MIFKGTSRKPEKGITKKQEHLKGRAINPSFAVHDPAWSILYAPKGAQGSDFEMPHLSRH